MANDTLEVVAGKINALTEKMGKATKDIRSYRDSRNSMLVEVHERIVKAKEIDISWEAWVSANVNMLRTSVDKIIRQLTGPKPQGQSGLPEVQNQYVEPGPVDIAMRREELERPKEPEVMEETKAFKALERAWFDAEEATRKAWVAYHGFVTAEEHRAQYKNGQRLLHEATAEILKLTDAVTADRATRNFAMRKVAEIQPAEPKKVRGEISDAAKALVERINDCSSKKVWIRQRLAEFPTPQEWSPQSRGVHTQIVDDFYTAEGLVRLQVIVELAQIDKRAAKEVF